MAVISVQNLRMQYGKQTALNDLSFEIESGESFVLLGPNGAGKSTCVEILEGFRKRTSGKVSVLGKDPNNFSRADRASIGIVLQQSGDLGKLTVREIVAHFASLYPNPKDVDEVIAAVDLEAKASSPIQKLSGGQQHRVDVALGMVGNPEVLFLDEPTTGFDPEVRRGFWEVINNLRKDGTTIMLTTHYLDEAEHLADRAGILINGQLVALDEIGKIGGVDRRQAKIRWQDNGQWIEVVDSKPSAKVSELHATYGELENLEIRMPSLESIYLDFLKEHNIDEIS